MCTVVTERECCYTTESSLSFGEYVALAVILDLTFLFTLFVGVSIGVLIVLAVNKCRNITLQSETEMIPPLVIYEEPL